METKDLISKAKYKLFKGFPFFSYLVDNLNIVEDNTIETMAVDGKGNVYYNTNFIQEICKTENNVVKSDKLLGVLTHEALHLVFEHPKRMSGRKVMVGNYSLWNIAGDIYINNVIVMNYSSSLIVNNGNKIEMSLPDSVILPKDNCIEMFGKKIENISEKTTEDIYDELKDALKQKMEQQGKGKGGKGEQGEGTVVSGLEDECKGFDEHRDWDKASGKEGEENTKAQEGAEGVKQQAKDWKKILSEANTIAQQRGQVPNGMTRELSELHKSKINWKNFLDKAIRASIPQDYTWNKPNKKYIGEGIYLPSTYGETVKVLFSVDTSGSISKEDLTDYISEIVAVSKCFSGIEFRFLTHDIEVYEDIHIYNGNIRKMLATPISGGGGTSHKPLYEHIKKKRYTASTKLLISFTDGYSDFPDKLTIPTIFVLSRNHCPKKDLPKKAVAVLEIM